jgi:hypothetical protein
MAIRNIPEVPGYLTPTIGSTSVPSGATVSTVAGLTLSNPSLYTASTNEASASSVDAVFAEGKVPGGLGVRTVGGVKRYFIPSQYLANPDFLYSVPIGSDVTVYTIPCNNGVCGFYTQFLKTTSVYDGNSFAVTNYDGGTAYDDNFSTGSGAALTLGFVYSGTQAAVTVPAVNLRDLDKNTPASLYQLIKTKKIVLEKFQGHPTNKGTTTTTTWTVPAGVYSIDATLIGGGGAGGGVNVSAQALTSSSSSMSSYGGAGGNTTITYNGVTYTAEGGPQGIEGIATCLAPVWSWFVEDWMTASSASASTSLPYEDLGNNKPGRGGLGVQGSVSATNSLYKTINGVSSQFKTFDRNNAQGGSGFDGEERHFTIPVVPGNNLSLTIGASGREFVNDQHDYDTCLSNPGAIYIRYVR